MSFHSSPVVPNETSSFDSDSTKMNEKENQLTPDELQDTMHLLFFASQGHIEGIVELLKLGTDVNSADYDGRTALHLAASEGRLEVVELLLANGANVNPRDRWGSTPLSDARHYGYAEVAKLLTSKGGKLPLGSSRIMSPAGSPIHPKHTDFEVDPNEIDFSRSALLGKNEYCELKVANWRGTSVAVKIIQLSPEMEDQLHETFQDELNLLQKLRHPNIVQFLGAVSESHPYMLVTEYLPRGNLEQILLRKKTLQAEEALRYALDIARGMTYLHQAKPHPIIHKDLKPRNLIRDEAGHLKVSDFAITKILRIHVDTSVSGKFDNFSTQNFYTAPEIFLNKKIDKSVDVYSFGVILFEMFEGLKWKSAEDKLHLIERITDKFRPEFTSNQYPEGIKDLITKCWDHHPKNRPSFLQITEILEAVESKMNLEKMKIEKRNSPPNGCHCVIL